MTDFFEKESFLGATVAEWLLLIASMLLYLLSTQLSGPPPAPAEALSARPFRSATLAG